MNCDIKCNLCEISFTQKKNLYAHVRKFHPHAQIELSKKSNNSCCLCDDAFSSIKLLHQHMVDKHSFDIRYEKKTFYCETDFLAWKENVEKETLSQFVIHHSEKKLSDERTVVHFRCSRSGAYKPTGQGKRHLKISGSQKIGKMCPAYISMYKTTIKDAIEIVVEYQPIHAGHEGEIGRMHLTLSEKSELAGQLYQGVPKTTVLTKVQQNFSPTKRISYTTKKDLHNISKTFNINDGAVYDENDLMSVDYKIKELMKEDYNPVLIYKPYKDTNSDHPHLGHMDFALALMNEAQEKLLSLYGESGVMIDSTHGTNRFKYTLTTLMVNDDNHEGLPVAFMYSSNQTTETMETFFSAIKKKLPSLTPSYLMTDDSPTFINAWNNVFCSDIKHLLCAWHVKRAWKDNLNKVKDPELRPSIKNDLKNLLEESDVLAFRNFSDYLLAKYMASEETKAFAEYLQKKYMFRAEKWAYCFRLNCKVNVNMKLERWHRQIKYEEAGGKVIVRLDKSLAIVLSAISKKLINIVISKQRGKLTTKVADIRKRHASSLLMNQSLITEIQPLQCFILKSSKSTETMFYTHEVNYINKTCPYEKSAKKICKIRCSDCNVCIHQLSCTCLDYSIRYVICKHIHAVCTHYNVTDSGAAISDDQNKSEEIDDNELDCTAISKELTKNKVNTDAESLENEKSALKASFQALLDKCQSAEDIKVLKGVIALGQNKLMAMEKAKQASAEVNEEFARTPHNKKIDQQRRYVKAPVKRKREHM